MKNYHLALLIISALLINNIIADGMEEVVVTSSLLESSEINNPLYVIDGEDITDGATFYHADYVMPAWAKTKTKTVEIEDHIFYSYKR